MKALGDLLMRGGDSAMVVEDGVQALGVHAGGRGAREYAGAPVDQALPVEMRDRCCSGTTSSYGSTGDRGAGQPSALNQRAETPWMGRRNHPRHVGRTDRSMNLVGEPPDRPPAAPPPLPQPQRLDVLRVPAAAGWGARSGTARASTSYSHRFAQRPTRPPGPAACPATASRRSGAVAGAEFDPCHDLQHPGPDGLVSCPLTLAEIQAEPRNHPEHRRGLGMSSASPAGLRGDGTWARMVLVRLFRAVSASCR